MRTCYPLVRAATPRDSRNPRDPRDPTDLRRRPYPLDLFLDQTLSCLRHDFCHRFANHAIAQALQYAGHDLLDDAV